MCIYLNLMILIKIIRGFISVECEVCESGGLIQLRINVPHHEIYRSMKALKQWLESQLLHMGYIISLEIFYVKNSE